MANRFEQHEVMIEKIEKSIKFLKEDLNTLRAGRANPAILDKVMVEYYGTPTPLKNLSNISVPEPRLLLITPFDPKSIPQVTEERRKELTKTAKKMGEEAKVAVRNLRRDINDELKKMEKASEITEDDLKGALDEAQKIVDDSIKKIDGIVADKEKEIMEV